MEIVVVEHPLVAQRLTRLRDERTGSAGFRLALHDLSRMLMYEATRRLPLGARGIQTPTGDAVDGVDVLAAPVVIPVLRAGLGMLTPALELLPQAQTGFIGIARHETTHAPHAYLESLPPDMTGRTIFVLDPMLATGGSLLRACRFVTDRGAAEITVVTVLASPEGIEALRVSGLPLNLVTAAVDQRLDERAFIRPGLGDAGDRQFGAR